MSLNAKRAHAVNDWTDKIDVENGNNVHRMEKDSDTEEAEPPKARHLDKMNVELTRKQRTMDRRVDLEIP